MAKPEGQMCEAPAIRSADVSRHDYGVAGFGEPARLNHISKTVLSIVKFGGPGVLNCELFGGWFAFRQVGQRVLY